MTGTAAVESGGTGALRKSRAWPSWLPGKTNTARYVLIVISHLLLLAAWQALAMFGKLPAFVLPAPAATAATLWGPNYHWVSNTLATASEVFGGYCLGAIAAVVLAMVFCWFRLIESLLMPVLVSFNMIPKVALGPLIIVWFKYGIGPNMLIAFSICFFPIVLTTARGLREVDPDPSRSYPQPAGL
jgi:NitT/TauT family transport system permease protein